MPREASTDFVPPAFAADVPLEAYLADCPATATTRGTFFEYVEKLVREKLGKVDPLLYNGVERRRYVPFKTYPLAEFMRLCHNAARLTFPRLSTGEALRQIGWVCYPSFAATMAGRVVLFAFGQRLEDVITSTSKCYTLGLPGSTASASVLGPRHVRIEMRDVYSFAETYHAGVLEGPVRAFGFVPEVRVRRHARRSDVDFDLRWEAP